MKRSYLILAALALGLFAAGCVFTSGQIRIAFNLDNFTTSTQTQVTKEDINLNDEEEYEKHKGDLQDLSDLALLGQITNTGASAINVELWMTPAITSHADVASLKGDATALRIWGPFSLGVGETKKIDWDKSAALFSSAGKSALLSEAKGDGIFTVYAIADAGTYSFDVSHGVLVLVLDIGI